MQATVPERLAEIGCDGSALMSNVIRFPRTAAGIPATPIPREQFERLAGLALDVVDQIVALLDADGATESDGQADTGPGHHG